MGICTVYYTIMVTIDDFKYILSFWKEYKIPNIIERDTHIDLETDKIIAIAGSNDQVKPWSSYRFPMKCRLLA